MNPHDILTGLQHEYAALIRSIAQLRETIGRREGDLGTQVDPDVIATLKRRNAEDRQQVREKEQEAEVLREKIRQAKERIKNGPRLWRLPLDHWNLLSDLKRAAPFPEVHSFVAFFPEIEQDLEGLRRKYIQAGYHHFAAELPKSLSRFAWRASLGHVYGPPLPPPPPPGHPPMAAPPCFMPNLCMLSFAVHEFEHDSGPRMFMEDPRTQEGLSRDNVYESREPVTGARTGMTGWGQDSRMCAGKLLLLSDRWVLHKVFLVVLRGLYQPPTPRPVIRQLSDHLVEAMVGKLDGLGEAH